MSVLTPRDGKAYPCYMIPAKRLASGAKLELEMGSDATGGLGDLYVALSGEFILDAELVAASRLKCVIESAADEATTKFFSRTKPGRVMVTGQAAKDWANDETKRTVTIQSAGAATIEVSLP